VTARILVVEDDAASLELVRYLLDAAGYETSSATDGARGVELALGTRPDLVICDLRMPVLTGFDVVRRLRQDPDWRPVPLVAVSAFSMQGDREQALAAGFDAYFPKPIMPETFVAEIEVLLATGLRAARPA
jgi:two-component system cell cycle response regulator DivK